MEKKRKRSKDSRYLLQMGYENQQQQKKNVEKNMHTQLARCAAHNMVLMHMPSLSWANVCAKALKLEGK